MTLEELEIQNIALKRALVASNRIAEARRVRIIELENENQLLLGGLNTCSPEATHPDPA